MMARNIRLTNPAPARESVYANRQATLDARKRAAQFFAQYLGN
jgi:hypothetical protein